MAGQDDTAPAVRTEGGTVVIGGRTIPFDGEKLALGRVDG